MPGTRSDNAAPLLDVDRLSVGFTVEAGVVPAVRGVSFSVAGGETLGIVGESGSGKSQSVLSIIGLLADNARTSGSVRFRGRELLGLPPRALNRLRGDRIGMIFQDPMTSLNPYLPVERQLTEVLVTHKGMSQRTARQRAVEALDAVRIPDARARIRRYPHELSGGMRQRVVIAMALLCRPDLLIADEPTTALDVTVQAQILDLLRDLRRDFGMSIILITHDLGVVAGLCDRIMVMYAGEIAETGSVDEIFHDPQHPYTRGLLRSLPRLEGGTERLATIPGNPPNLLALPEGCPFRPRCPHAFDRCRTEAPALREFAPGRHKSCHLRGFDDAGTAASG